MKKMLIIAETTLKETIRNKILYNILLFAVFIFFLGIIIGNWSLGEQERVILDFGLTGLHLIALLIAIFIGIHLVAREIQSRTIYNTLSKSVTRTQFLLGKFCGLAVVLLFNLLLLAIVLNLLVFLFTGQAHPGILVPVMFIYLEMLIIIAIAILFSMVTGSTLASILTIAVYIAGHMMGPVLQFLEKVEEIEHTPLYLPYLIIRGVRFIIPDLGVFVMIDEYIHGVALSEAFYGFTLLYFLLYLTAILVIGIMIFQKKDLK